MKTVNDIRNEFLNFFKDKGHAIVPSSSLVPDNDPTLMFTNAGMNQFKNVFTGKEHRDYTRATTAQKCVRAGGKHNDLENVGYTARHLTFFEMLGNFSFGDYFKEDAIAFSWELLTKNFAIDPEKLCVTIYHTDDEAFDIWKKVTGFHDSKIIRIATDDNFWRMGDTGPCGPSTEIFYDHGDQVWGGPPGSPEEDGDRFIEIWNNVFMQYEQVDADTQIDLPAQSVDTGMGLERLAATLMGSHSNYDIDIFQDIMNHSADLTGVEKDGAQAASHKVIADHLRSAAFLIADGVLPSNEGRGYVLRRIMRRGMRHAHLLGAQDPLMHQLFPTLKAKMGDAYPELGRASALITETLRSEEERFKRTLDKGLKILDEETASIGEGGTLAGDVAFKLYDTFGFPLDLTQDALKAQNIAVDTDGFDACMAEQKAKARAAWSGSGDTADEKIWFDILDEHGATEFLGYEVEAAEGEVRAIVKDGARVDALNAGEEGFVITNQTPFYAESGGQVGDTGRISVIGSDVEVKPVSADFAMQSDRLNFKLIGAGDTQAVFDVMNFEHTAKTISFMKWPMTMDQAEWWVQRSVEGVHSGADYCFIARKGEEAVGCIGVHPEAGNKAEIGYWVAEPCQGQGMAQEMLKAAVDFALNTLGLKSVYATTLEDNRASERVLTKAGFVMQSGLHPTTSLDGVTYMKRLHVLDKGASVIDTKKIIGALHAHKVRVNTGALAVGNAVEMAINHARRTDIRANHSATHLLHEALRQVLGEHVAQKGSLQDDQRTRFDISHTKAITAAELAQVEEIVNNEIRANTPIETRLMPIDEARASGAMALFGEKYADEVRVVAMGTQPEGANKPFSVELCGGTHAKRTGDIGLLKIVSEGALSAGVRRIEALTGRHAFSYLKEQDNRIQQVAATLKGAAADVPARLETLLGERKAMEKEIADLRKQIAMGGASGGSANDDVKDINGMKFVGKVLAGFPAKDLKPMADELKAKIGSGVVVLVATDEGKASIVVGVTDDLTDKISAVDLVRLGAAALGGKGGGGRPDMAQAGGTDPSSAQESVEAIAAAVAA